ncbi:MAG: hypothetical protein QF792_00670 [Phycisphaerae bacterium]|nr:hypothetical protein [Phycisphaerae bacterium]
MLKRIGCMVLLLAMLVAVSGCGDDVKVERTTEIKDVPIGQPTEVVE